jgi:hypothetical protein
LRDGFSRPSAQKLIPAVSRPDGRKGAAVHLVQILLPVRDNAGEAFAPQLFEGVAKALTAHFGGVTAYNRSPAEGRWQSSGTVHHDEVMVMEVMMDELDRVWWKQFRDELEQRFRQDQIIVRAQTIELM